MFERQGTAIPGVGEDLPVIGAGILGTQHQCRMRERFNT